MTLPLVGTASGQGPTIALPVGVQSSDLVLVLSGADNATHGSLATPTGYTAGQSGTHHGVRYAWSWRRMGATPDAEVAGLDTLTAGRHVVTVWRGVDLEDALDVAAPTPSSGSSGMPTAPAVTTANADAIVVIAGVLVDDLVASSVAAPSGFTLAIASEGGATDAGVTAMVASLTQGTPGTVTPGAFTATGGDDGWVGVTVPLRGQIAAYRITEDGSYRVTEDDEYRITEGTEPGPPPILGAGDGALELGSEGVGTIRENATGTGDGAIELGSDGVASVRAVGAGDGALEVSSDGVGALASRGTGAGALEVGSDGVGVVRVFGTGADAIELTSSGAGVGRVSGTGDGAVEIGATGAGVLRATGTGSGSVELGSDGVGSLAARGTGDGAVELGSDGSAAVRVFGTGEGAVELTSDGLAFVPVDGTGDGAVELGSDGVGVAVPPSRRVYGDDLSGPALVASDFSAPYVSHVSDLSEGVPL